MLTASAKLTKLRSWDDEDEKNIIIPNTMSTVLYNTLELLQIKTSATSNFVNYGVSNFIGQMPFLLSNQRVKALNGYKTIR